MYELSTYFLLGWPEALSVSITIFLLALSIAPFLGGLEIGPVKVPELPKGSLIPKVAGVLTLLAILGFLPIWSGENGPAIEKTNPPVAAETSTSKSEELYGCIGESLVQCATKFQRDFEYHRGCDWHKRQDDTNMNFASEVCSALHGDQLIRSSGVRLSTSDGGCGYGNVKIICEFND